MISYDEALQKVITSVTPLNPVLVPLSEAAGLILAAPAIACLDMPRWNNSAMDGFAINSLLESFDGGLTIIGASYAGTPFDGKISPGETVRITTGAALPDGSDLVVPLEEVIEKNGQIFLEKRPKQGQHVRYKSEEFASNEVLVKAGAALNAGEISLLASAGIEKVMVYPRPHVAVISTGDEIVELGQPLGPGQIINSSLYYLRTRLRECGCPPLCLGTSTDDAKSLDTIFKQTLEANLVITTGGVSVGEKDHVHEALNRHAFEKIFWKVAIKPGKPVLYGKLDNIPFFGLPGNPAATAATFELFVKPALKKLAGHQDVLPEKRKAILTNDVIGRGNRQAFLWCTLKWEEGSYKVSVSERQASGQNCSLISVNALLPFPVGADKLNAGQKVEVLLLDSF